uniref:Candidate secreted effector n=1 Tax=Meloidogyne incognita TaxID=6306 RepID=A0A914L068_MELIC
MLTIMPCQGRKKIGPKTLTCQTSWSFTRSVIFYGTNSASIPFRNVYVWWSKQVWSSHLEPVRVIKCRKLREVLREGDHRRGTKSMGVLCEIQQFHNILFSSKCFQI